MTGPTARLAPIGSIGMTEAEWVRIGRWRRRHPMAELLGMVVNELGTHLAEAEWTHGWFAMDTVRLEWAGGPSIAAVLEVLLPVDVDGELYGVPGLRVSDPGEPGYATLRWLPAPPTRVHITRLPGRRRGSAAGADRRLTRR